MSKNEIVGFKSVRIGCALAALLWGVCAEAYEWSDGGAGPDYVFGSPASPLASGILNVGAARDLKSITVYAAADAKISVTNGSLSFADAGGVVTSPGATLSLDLPISSAGTLAFGTTAQKSSETVAIASLPATVKTGADLSSWRISGAQISTVQTGPVTATAYNEERTPEGLDVQLEALIDARLCCLKVRLVEQDGNLVVSKVYARSLKTGDASVKLDPGEGINFDAIPVGNDDEGAGVAHDSALTISSLTLEGVVAKSRIAVADAATFGGAVSVGEDVELSVPEGSPLAGGSFGQKLTLDGTLVLAESQAFPNEIAGEARSRMDISHPISHQMVTELASFEVTKVDKTVYDTTIPNCYVYQIKGVSSDHPFNVSGAWSDGSTAGNAACVRSFTNDGHRAKLVVHGFFKNSYTASCWVDFKQEGSDVVVHHVKKLYVDEKKTKPEDSLYYGKRDLDDPTIDQSLIHNWDYRLSTATMILEKPPVSIEIPKVTPLEAGGTSVVLQNVSLDDIAGFRDINLAGAKSSEGNVGVFFWHREGSVATAQFQGFFGSGQQFTACCFVRLVQQGSDVCIQVTKARSKYETTQPSSTDRAQYFGKDFETLPDTDVWKYWISSAFVDVYPRGGAAVATFAGSGTAPGGRVSVGSNACAKVTARDALPKFGTVVVKSGGQASFGDADFCAYDYLTLRIERGGATWLQREGVCSPWNTYFDIRGGFVHATKRSYMSRVTFADGGEVDGDYPVWAGQYCNGYWAVRGSRPAVLSAGLAVTSDEKPGSKVEFDVENVTGDGEADFISTGALTTYNEAKRMPVLVKKGVGTWLIGKACTTLYNPIRIEGGEVLLGCADAAPSSGCDVGGIELAGGTLAAGASLANNVCGLRVTADSVVDLRDGATLNVTGSCRSFPWTGTLTIKGFTGTNIRFGAGRKALTFAQRDAIRVEGHPELNGRWALDENGYLVEKKGIVLVVR